MQHDLLRANGGADDVVKGSCLLAAPTGCASFQIKNGATTVHRAFGVPVGYCGPFNKKGKAYARVQAKLKHARLAVLDEYSMIGRMFFGKFDYRASEALGHRSKNMRGHHVSMGGLDVVLAGHSAQARPIGDDPLYKMGTYSGKGLNKPPKGEKDSAAPSCKSLVERGCLLRDEFQDVALLRSVWRIDDGHDGMTEAERSAYRSEADQFLSVTGRIAELEWTQQDHAWLAKRNRNSLLATEDGRREVDQFNDAPLLMDGRRKNAAGEDGAEQFNARELRRLSVRTGRPIAAIGAYHDRPESARDLKPEQLDEEEFRKFVDDLRVSMFLPRTDDAIFNKLFSMLDCANGWLNAAPWIACWQGRTLLVSDLFTKCIALQPGVATALNMHLCRC